VAGLRGRLQLGQRFRGSGAATRHRMHDMLGINVEFKPRFLRKYLNLYEEIDGAVKQYIHDVKTKDFPNENEQY
jgi:ketopantoate hydroxymethyltransferase